MIHEKALQKAVYVEQGKNLFDKNAVTHGYLKNNGEFATHTNWSTSDFISVVEGQTYTYKGLTNVGNEPYSAYYNKQKQFIENFKQQSGTNSIAIPANVYYVRFSVNNLDLNTFQLERGNASSAYECYKDKQLLDAEGQEIFNITDFIKTIVNENGTAIKFPDGTMICTKKISFSQVACTTALGSLFSSEALDLGNFAEAFVETPTVNINKKGSYVGIIVNEGSSTNTSIGTVTFAKFSSRKCKF